MIFYLLHLKAWPIASKHDICGRSQIAHSKFNLLTTLAGHDLIISSIILADPYIYFSLSNMIRELHMYSIKFYMRALQIHDYYHFLMLLHNCVDCREREDNVECWTFISVTISTHIFAIDILQCK